jgi:hypothetical protein
VDHAECRARLHRWRRIAASLEAELLVAETLGDRQKASAIRLKLNAVERATK